ncbi:hypothetical protein CJF32_00006826 [Rutstroemia sp. NJR-2017a WRK4]|nr:hypothetical protein CJF32_00006826 [Rutstroemia sp. NJR-2017a WRK4]
MEQTPSHRTKKTEFTSLPFEIRLKIWRAMLPHRQLNIREGRLEVSARRQIERGIIVFIGNRFATPGAELPIGLHINFESRQETLKHYKVLHRPVVHNGKILTSYKGLFLINTDLDTVFMTQPALLCCDKAFIQKFIAGTFEYYGEENIKIRDAIKKIEIYILERYPNITYKTENIEQLLKFQGLEEIALVRHPDPPGEGQDSNDHMCSLYRAAFEVAKARDPTRYGEREMPMVTMRFDTCVTEFEQPEFISWVDEEPAAA